MVFGANGLEDDGRESSVLNVLFKLDRLSGLVVLGFSGLRLVFEAAWMDGFMSC